jgi:predicted DNA-binding transcriptional regulator YafY
MRIDRLLGITVTLLNRDRVTARELAERFEVSIRTVYRDLETIHLAGIPVVSQAGNRGGVGILDTFRIDRQVLTFDDIVSLVSTLRGVNGALENRELDAAVEKIANLLPRRGDEALKRLGDRIVIDMLPLGCAKKQKDCLQTVHQAVMNRRLIRFEYRNNRGESATRTVEPMTLVLKGTVWYLFGFCRLKTDFRLFRLSRMTNLAVTDETFERREKSYREFFARDPSSSGLVDLRLRFSPGIRTRVEDFFDPDGIRTDADGRLLVDVTFPEDEWVYSFLLGFGEHLEVLAPDRIRGLLRDKAEKMQALYDPERGVRRSKRITQSCKPGKNRIEA